MTDILKFRKVEVELFNDCVGCWFFDGPDADPQICSRIDCPVNSENGTGSVVWELIDDDDSEDL